VVILFYKRIEFNSLWVIKNVEASLVPKILFKLIIY